MRSAFDSFTIFDNDDLISTAHGGKAVSDNQCSPADGKFSQSLLDLAFTFIIQSTGSLVKDEDLRIFEKYPGYTDALFLSS